MCEIRTYVSFGLFEAYLSFVKKTDNLYLVENRKVNLTD